MVVGENGFPAVGDMMLLSAEGSISRFVRNDVSARSSLFDVTERKMSKSFCWSVRGVPLRSRICGIL